MSNLTTDPLLATIDFKEWLELRTNHDQLRAALQSIERILESTNWYGSDSDRDELLDHMGHIVQRALGNPAALDWSDDSRCGHGGGCCCPGNDLHD